MNAGAINKGGSTEIIQFPSKIARHQLTRMRVSGGDFEIHAKKGRRTLNLLAMAEVLTERRSILGDFNLIGHLFAAKFNHELALLFNTRVYNLSVSDEGEQFIMKFEEDISSEKSTQANCTH